MKDETHIRKYKININWVSGTLQTKQEAQEYLDKIIKQLKEEWTFNIEGGVD